MRVVLLCSVVLGFWRVLAAQSSQEEKAEALLAAGKFREARQLAARALQGNLTPEASSLWKSIAADALHGEGDHEEAARVYGELSQATRGPLAIGAGLRLAKCRLEMWDGEGAKEALKGLGPAEGDLAAERDELLAIATFVSGRQNEARELLEQLERRSDAGWHYLGLIAYNGGEYKRGLECFDKAIAASPPDYYNLLYKASCLLELNRLDEAREAFQAVRLVAETPEVYQFLGRLEIRSGRFAEAERQLRKALSMASDNADVQFSLMTALRRQGKSQEAQEAAKRFQELHQAQQAALQKAYALDQKYAANPRDPEIAEALAIHYLQTGDPAAAERMSWRAIRIDPRRVSPRLYLARSLSAVGRYREAALQYRKILGESPGNKPAEQELRALIEKHARRVDGPAGSR